MIEKGMLTAVAPGKIRRITFNARQIDDMESLENRNPCQRSGDHPPDRPPPRKESGIL